MLPHRVKRHRSATAIVREFLGPQLAVVPEELVWVPAHPSYPDDGGFTYDDMLRAVRKQRHWAFVRVPKDKRKMAVIHFYAADGVPLSDVAKMLGHELGHISGDILDDEVEEEKRADKFGVVAARVLEMLTSQERKPARTSRRGKANRQAPSSGGQAGYRDPQSRTAPTAGVTVRKKRA